MASTRVAFAPEKLEFPVPMDTLGEMEHLRAEATELDARARDAEAELDETRSDLEAARSVAEQQGELIKEQTLALEGAASAVDKASTRVNELQAEFAVLENDYEVVRTELAEVRVAQKRESRQTERTEMTQQQLLNEIEGLRARLIKLDGPAADLDLVLAERDTLRNTLRRLTASFHDVMSTVVTGKALPSPPIPGVEDSQERALDAWVEEVANRAAVTATRGAERETAIRSLRGQLSRVQRRVQLLDAAAPPSSPPSLEVRVTQRPTTDTAPELEALKAALKAEEMRRILAEQRADAAYVAAESAISQYGAIRDALISTQETLQEARTARVVADERFKELQAELAERRARLAELEAMLTTHQHLHGLMADTVVDAESARDEADAARRLAETNLEVMRGEFERLRTSDSSRA